MFWLMVCRVNYVVNVGAERNEKAFRNAYKAIILSIMVYAYMSKTIELYCQIYNYLDTLTLYTHNACT